MKKIKVSEASGTALDWMVAKCEGIKTDIPAWADKPWVRCTDDNGVQFVCPKFSTDWAQGGPIIERENIETIRYVVPATLAEEWRSHCKGVKAFYGRSYLEASMRCYVASRLGNEVDVPDELTE